MQGVDNVSNNCPPPPTTTAPPNVPSEPPSNLPPTCQRKRRLNANGNRKRSEVWDHFNPIPNSDPPTAACKYCHQKYMCDSKKHGTSNLKSHMKTCPKYPLNLSTDPTQTVLSYSTTEGSVLVPISSRFSPVACRNGLAIFIILDEKPFSTVEGEGFKYFCSQMQPQFSIPSRRTIARDCFQLYLDEKVRLRAFFKSDCSRVAITTDCWTSVQNLNYLTITAHFIDREWNYQKRIISFTDIENHRGKTVGKKVEDVLKEWGLRNVSTITVDNAASNDVAVRYLEQKIRNMNGLLMDGFGFHMRCCAHVLNLVVRDGLQVANTSISSVRNAIRFVRSSPHRALKFKECVEYAGIECKKSVCLDVSTRWNSTYLMLDGAEKFQTAFDKLENEDESYRDFFEFESPPSIEDWDNVRVFIKFLKQYYDATKVFSVSTKASLHTAFPYLAGIYVELKNLNMNLNGLFAQVARDMLEKYSKYWIDITKMNQLLYFGVIFDPRYKLRFVEWCFNDMYGKDSDTKKSLLKDINANLSKMFNLYVQQYDTTVDSNPSVAAAVSQGETAASNEIPTHVARENAFQEHLMSIDSVEEETELQSYIEGKCLTFSEKDKDKFDLLCWWKHNAAQYPILSQIVRDIMPTPVSTVASESAFSTGGRVLEVYRSSLKPEMAEALICAQNWLRPSFYQFKDLEFNEEYEISEDVLQGFTETSVGSEAPSSSQTQSQPFGFLVDGSLEWKNHTVYIGDSINFVYDNPSVLISLCI
ncbi:zinc finger BED domain-containing protein RICESLEEPER 2-like [Vicia villosa]|uniref:zinc finger BED domain-containing protein RICESLEEPER 2-like n=1 Tax=Vicia villosa TaxID=3911 RepID=UPI00273B6955|nr:zinc finger BED domain-containing protein RICESLEEPER 2-like [Vicia villosa]